MISKLGAILTLSVAALFLAPASLHAASSSDQKKIASLSKRLNKLPNAGAAINQVQGLVLKLTKLDPKKAKKWIKIGLKKLKPANASQNAVALQVAVVNTVKKSGLSSSEVAKINGQVKKEVQNYVPPTPTPTPYQASILSGALAV
ncbi:MAG: hypothetical protein PHC88_10130 [Terrimicrobiaceae bacterium]|nr:hypothetical protein [Terrimicrobiaceae bacterium]